MIVRILPAVLAILFPAFVSCQENIRTTAQPVESEHRRGPNGFEGWTLNYTVIDHRDERYPMTLVIAREGHIRRKIEGEPFLWRWIFWANGRQVAYEAAPFHFSLDCVLADTKTGRRLASYDCFHGVPDNAPGWLKTLEGTQ